MLINIRSTGLVKNDANPYRSNPFAYGDNNNLVIAASAVTSSVLEHHRSQPDVSHFCHRTVHSFGVVPTTAPRYSLVSLHLVTLAGYRNRIRGWTTTRPRHCCSHFKGTHVLQ